MRNTSFQRVGPRTLDISKAQQFVVGDPVSSAPVETPSGALLLAIQVVPPKPISANNQNPNPTWTVRQINPQQTSGLPITAFSTWVSGQIATPAVDSQGAAYLATYTYSLAGPGNSAYVTISKIRADGTLLWSNSDATTFPRPSQAPAPKLVEIGGNVAVFVGVMGKSDYRILAIDGSGRLHSVTSCTPSESNSGFFASAAPPGPPPPPYFEDPTLSLATDANNTPYLIDSANSCGIGFFELASFTTVPADWPNGLLFPKFIKLERTGSQLGTPAVSTFAENVLLSQNGSLEAYDFTKGEKIKNWPKGIASAPSPSLAIALNSVLILNNSYLSLVATDHPTLATAPAYLIGNVYATALTPNMVYALGDSGVYAFDTSMNLKSFAAIPPGKLGNGGGMIVTSKGSLVVASRNGTTYIFPQN